MEVDVPAKVFVQASSLIDSCGWGWGSRMDILSPQNLKGLAPLSSSFHSHLLEAMFPRPFLSFLPGEE